MKLRVYHTTGVLMESRDVPWCSAQEVAERASWSGFAVLQSWRQMIWFKGGREVARRGLRKAKDVGSVGRCEQEGMEQPSTKGTTP